MAANNSCGSRSLRYGIMRDNLIAIDALLADGSKTRFEETPRAVTTVNDSSLHQTLMPHPAISGSAPQVR